MRIFFIVIISLVILYLLFTYFFFILISRKLSKKILPMSKFVEESVRPYKDIVLVGNDWIKEKYKNKEIKDVYIKSFDNLKLHGIFIENKKSKGIIIEAHGYRSTAENDLFASCHEYFKMGYSLLLIDQRTSNKSEGKYITFGIKESKDIINWIKFVNSKYPKKKVFLTHLQFLFSFVANQKKKFLSTKEQYKSS